MPAPPPRRDISGRAAALQSSQPTLDWNPFVCLHSPAACHREMPRKSSKPRGAAVRGPHLKAMAPNPSPIAAAQDLKVPDAGIAAATEAFEQLHVPSAASDGDPPEEPPPPEQEAPPPPQPPAEASSSGRAAVGQSREEEAVMKLHELAAVGGKGVELTEEELRANDQRQEDEVTQLFSIRFDS